MIKHLKLKADLEITIKMLACNASTESFLETGWQRGKRW